MLYTISTHTSVQGYRNDKFSALYVIINNTHFDCELIVTNESLYIKKLARIVLLSYYI